MSHFIGRGQRIVFAGSDIRFVRKPGKLFERAGAVDFAFEATLTSAERGAPRRVATFTPDLVVAFPTRNARTFVDSIVGAMRGKRSWDVAPAPAHRGADASVATPP